MCDPDTVDLSNLQRQIQFTTADVGRRKADALADEARRLGLDVDARAVRFDAASVDALAGDADVLIDGSDDPATKLLVGDWAARRGRAHVIAGVLRWGGNVYSGAAGASCYRCLFEDAPDDAPTCADAGVLGAACAVIGGLAAEAALALARGDLGDAGSILVVDDVRAEAPPRRVRFGVRADCPNHRTH